MLNIEIKIVDRSFVGQPQEIWEELWIDGARHVSCPNSLDGNHVAHCIALRLRELGIPAEYNLTGWEKLKK